MHQEVGEERQHACRHEGAGLIAGGGRRAHDLDEAKHGKDGDERAHEAEGAADQLGEVGACELLPVADAAELLGEGGPAVLGVPDENRQRQEEGEGAAGPKLPGAEPRPVRANEGEPQDDAGTDEQVGVLGEQAQAGAQTHREPPVGVARCPQLRKRPSGEAPEQDGGGIGRDDHAADRQQGHRQREPDGAPPDARAEQEGRRAPQHERADERDQDRAEPNTQRTVACNPAPGGNHPPDHRRVVEVAHGRRQRPQAVVGFIVGEAQRGGEPQAHERHAQNCGDKHGRGPSTLSIGPAWR